MITIECKYNGDKIELIRTQNLVHGRFVCNATPMGNVNFTTSEDYLATLARHLEDGKEFEFACNKLELDRTKAHLGWWLELEGQTVKVGKHVDRVALAKELRDFLK